MTYLPLSQRVAHRPEAGLLAQFRRVARAADRRRVGDEDGARKALGHDPLPPAALLAGASLEHLARIALG